MTKTLFHSRNPTQRSRVHSICRRWKYDIVSKIYLLLSFSSNFSFQTRTYRTHTRNTSNRIGFILKANVANIYGGQLKKNFINHSAALYSDAWNTVSHRNISSLPIIL